MAIKEEDQRWRTIIGRHEQVDCLQSHGPLHRTEHRLQRLLIRQPYTDVKGMVEAVLDEIINQDPKVHIQGYGGLVHVNNHAAAITDLAQYG